MSANAVSNKELYKVDVKLCYPFIEAITNTFKVQCNLNARVGKPSFKNFTEDDKADILIIATIATDKTMAQVVICLPNKVFFGVMSKMLGEPIAKMTPDLEDGAKELMNIVFNQAKKPLAEKGMAAFRSIPMVIFGEGVKLRYLARGQTVLLPFDTDVGPFNVEITTQDINISDSV